MSGGNRALVNAISSNKTCSRYERLDHRLEVPCLLANELTAGVGVAALMIPAVLCGIIKVLAFDRRDDEEYVILVLRSERSILLNWQFDSPSQFGYPVMNRLIRLNQLYGENNKFQEQLEGCEYL